MIVLKMRSANGKQAIAGLQVDGKGNVNEIEIDSHAVTTVHGRNNTVTGLLADAIHRHAAGEKRVFYLNKEEAISLLGDKQGTMPEITFLEGGFMGSIRDIDSPVKSKFESQTQTR